MLFCMQSNWLHMKALTTGILIAVLAIAVSCKKSKSTPLPSVSSFAGSGVFGYADGPAATAQFRYPTGIAFDNAGNMYVADPFSQVIRKVTTQGVVSTFAGSGEPGFVNGPAGSARFKLPYGVTVDAQNNVYVVELDNHAVRKITPAGEVSTLAGTGTSGDADGPGSVAQFNNPTGIAIDPNGNLYIADQGQNRIRKITPSGVVSTLAGGTLGYSDGNGTAAKFGAPFGVACDAQSNVYVADRANSRIRKISPAGEVTTLAGSGTLGLAEGTGTAASFRGIWGIAVDSRGNVFVCDGENHRIRKITPQGVVSTYAGTVTGFADGPAPNAQFNNPTGIGIDRNGAIYVADYLNSKIRKIDNR